jgi:site-specific DNA-methyltransferase (adenine-specific)
MTTTKHTVVIGDSRKLSLVEDESIELIVTSPAYWNIKDYGHKDQIGYGQSYKEFIEDLSLVWNECYRVLRYGCYMCIIVGNVYTRTSVFGRYKTIALPKDIIHYCEGLGFDLRTEIIWWKISTTNPTGGATFMGSLTPRNPVPTQEHEYILIFKKITPKDKTKQKVKDPKGEEKELSRIDKKTWFKYLRALWQIPGARSSKNSHPATFPLEIPYRLIQMYSFVGETVLDPFLGSGTTMKAAKILSRNSIGYELSELYLPIIKTTIGFDENIDKYQYKIKYDQKK